MTFRGPNLTILLALLAAAPLGAQQYIPIPGSGSATDITPDGEVVVGTIGGDSFVWRWRDDPAPTIIPGGSATGVSDDGSVICGDIIDAGFNAQVAAIWTEANGWQSLGWLPTALTCPSLSNAYDISGDGTTVVGLSWAGCDGRGFRWTAATGMQQLQVLANGANRCSAISSDGSALGGFAQGSFSRTPAYWNRDTFGAVLDPDFLGEVYNFNSNGDIDVGTLYFSGGFYSAYVRNALTGVITNLGKLHPTGWAAAATGISEDGEVIVGFDHIMLSRQAWVWTSSDGIISLNNRLAALGVTGVPPLLVCSNVSDDGNVIVGFAAGGTPFSSGGFIVELNSPKPHWTDLGQGLAGVAGTPVLDGNGSLAAGSSTSIVLTQGKPAGLAALVVGLSQVNLPLKQGILVPSVTVLLPGLTLSPSGAISLTFPWPDGTPSGLSLYWQMWIADAAGPAGFAASNGLQSTVP